MNEPPLFIFLLYIVDLDGRVAKIVPPFSGELAYIVSISYIQKSRPYFRSAFPKFRAISNQTPG